MHDVMKTGKE